MKMPSIANGLINTFDNYDINQLKSMIFEFISASEHKCSISIVPIFDILKVAFDSGTVSSKSLIENWKKVWKTACFISMYNVLRKFKFSLFCQIWVN